MAPMKSVEDEYISSTIFVLKRPVPNFSIGNGEGMVPKRPMKIMGKRQRNMFQEEPRKRRSLVVFAPWGVVTKKEAVRTAMLKMMKKGTEATRKVKREEVRGCQKTFGWMARRTRCVSTKLMANITLTLCGVNGGTEREREQVTYPAFSKISAAKTMLLFAGRKAHTILIVVVTVLTMQKSKNRSDRMNLWPRLELML